MTGVEADAYFAREERIIDVDVDIRLAREVRKRDERARKALAAVKATATIADAKTPDAGSPDRSEDERDLFAFLIGRPDLCERMYRSVASETLWAAGTVPRSVTVCDVLFRGAPMTVAYAS